MFWLLGQSGWFDCFHISFEVVMLDEKIIVLETPPMMTLYLNDNQTYSYSHITSNYITPYHVKDKTNNLLI